METILILSDLHFGKFFDPKFGTTQHLREQVEALLTAEGIKPSLILCPGDLTSVADVAEFEDAIQFLNQLREGFKLSKSDLIALVGNHDVNRQVNDTLKANSINEELARYLSANVQAKYHWPQFDVSGPVYGSGMIDRGDYNIITFNSSWNCIDDGKKNGEIGSEQMEWLQNLHTLPSAKKPCIVTLHHHPDPIPYPTSIKGRIKDLSQAVDGQEFLDACSKLDVQLIVHGHRHHPALINVISKGATQKSIPLLCAGSLSVEAKKRISDVPNFFHVVELDPLGVSSTIRTYNSTARGIWDSKFNPDFHETISPIQAIPGKAFTEPTSQEIDEEFETLWSNKKPICFESVSPSLRCKTRQETVALINDFAERKGKLMHGEFSSGGTILI